MLLIGRLKRAAALIARELEKVYGEYGLTEGSFDVLGHFAPQWRALYVDPN